MRRRGQIFLNEQSRQNPAKSRKRKSSSGKERTTTLMYERKNEPLLPRSKFILRMAYHFAFALGIAGISLAIGILGYHYLEGLSWIDSLLNSSMLLGGMGPVNPLQTTAGKLFASFYALFSGMIFLVIFGVLFAPLFHRILHHFHLEFDEEGDGQ